MAGKLNNFPTTVVYDRSASQSVITTGTSPTITGTVANIIDNDLTTAYQIRATSPVGGAGVSVLIDYGQVFWNVQFSHKASFTKNDGAGSATWTVDYSYNGTDWVTLDTGSVATGATGTSEESNTMIALRYVRFKIAFDTLNLTTTVYLSKIMGSA